MIHWVSRLCHLLEHLFWAEQREVLSSDPRVSNNGAPTPLVLVSESGALVLRVCALYILWVVGLVVEIGLSQRLPVHIWLLLKNCKFWRSCVDLVLIFIILVLIVCLLSVDVLVRLQDKLVLVVWVEHEFVSWFQLYSLDIGYWTIYARKMRLIYSVRREVWSLHRFLAYAIEICRRDLILIKFLLRFHIQIVPNRWWPTFKNWSYSKLTVLRLAPLRHPQIHLSFILCFWPCI